MSAPPPPPPQPQAPLPPPPPPPASMAKSGAPPKAAGGGARPDTSQLLREIERGVTLRRVPEGQQNQSQAQTQWSTPNTQNGQNGPTGNPDDIALKKKQIQAELNSTLQRRQQGERIRPHFVLPKNSTINAIYNQLQYLDQEKNANGGGELINEAPQQQKQQQPYYAKLGVGGNDDDDENDANNVYHEQPAAAAATFYNNGSNSPATAANSSSTLPRAAAKPAPGLMISHGKPNFVRPSAPVVRPVAAAVEPELGIDLSRTLRRLRSEDPLESPSINGSNNGSGGRNSPVVVTRVQTPPANGSPFVVRKNVPIVLQQQQQTPPPAAEIDTRNDEDISNVIRRLRSVQSPERQRTESPAANLVVFNNVAAPRPNAEVAAAAAPAVQWTFVPNTNGNGNGNGGTTGFQHTVEYTPQQQQPQRPAAATKTIISNNGSNGNGTSVVAPNWTFQSANGTSDAGFHTTVEYPTSNGNSGTLSRPAPPASPIETTLDSLKKTLASVSRSPVTGRKINPNQPQQQQFASVEPVTPPAPLGSVAGQQSIQRGVQNLRKVDLKQDSSWMNKHNLQSPPQSPPAAVAQPSFKLQQPQQQQQQRQHQPHVIQHTIQIVGGNGSPPVAVAAPPANMDVRNIVSFARDLADAPNRYPDTVVVTQTQTRTEPDGRIVKETTTKTVPMINNNNGGTTGTGGILDDDMFFTNLKFVIDENGDIRPNKFAQFQPL